MKSAHLEERDYPPQIWSLVQEGELLPKRKVLEDQIPMRRRADRSEPGKATKTDRMDG